MTKTALLIIDMQNDFVLKDAPFQVRGAPATLPNIRRVLDACRGAGLPVVHVTRAYRADGSDVEQFRKPDFDRRPGAVVGTPGCDIVSELAPIPGEYRIIKPRFSAFMATSLDLLLRRLQVDHLLVTGTQYPNCIRASAMDAIALDYAVTLVFDATSAQCDEVAAANITDLVNVGVRCAESAAVVHEIEHSVTAPRSGVG